MSQMDFVELTSWDALQKVAEGEDPKLVYFSHHRCNVCRGLKPRVRQLIENNFPELMLYYVNTLEHPQMAGQFSVFTVPTILVFFDGREYIRESRHVSISSFQQRLGKLHRIYFG